MGRRRPAPPGRGAAGPAQRILITGAGRGIGLEFTRRYLERGERVFATCRRPDAAPALAALGGAHPDRLAIVPLDVTDAESIRASHAVVRKTTDGLDLLINNAGMYSVRGSDDPSERLGELRFDDALLLLRANAIGPVIVAQSSTWTCWKRAGPEAPVTPARSVAGMISVIDGLTARHNGRFLNWEGGESPW